MSKMYLCIPFRKNKVLDSMLGGLRVGWDLKVTWSILCLQTHPLPIQG